MLVKRTARLKEELMQEKIDLDLDLFKVQDIDAIRQYIGAEKMSDDCLRRQFFSAAKSNNANAFINLLNCGFDVDLKNGVPFSIYFLFFSLWVQFGQTPRDVALELDCKKICQIYRVSTFLVRLLHPKFLQDFTLGFRDVCFRTIANISNETDMDVAAEIGRIEAQVQILKSKSDQMSADEQTCLVVRPLLFSLMTRHALLDPAANISIENSGIFGVLLASNLHDKKIAAEAESLKHLNKLQELRSKYCHFCRMKGETRKCSDCNFAFYCSRECQMSDRKLHQKYCVDEVMCFFLILILIVLYRTSLCMAMNNILTGSPTRFPEQSRKCVKERLQTWR